MEEATATSVVKRLFDLTENQRTRKEWGGERLLAVSPFVFYGVSTPGLYLCQS